MKYFLVIIIILMAVSGHPSQDNYFFNKNKKLFHAIQKRVKYTKSFAVCYIKNNDVDLYLHKTNIYKQYDIASVSKTFTAIVIIKLHSKQKLHLDSPVNKYIKYYDKNVTVRHLLTHSAFKPYGKLSSYSNINYIDLKNIIEKVTHKSYEYNVKKYILKPLKMNQTSAEYGNGAGSIFSSIHDLILYTKMLLNNGEKVLTKNEYNVMLQSSHENKNKNWYWSTGGYEVFPESFYKSGRWYYSVSGIEVFNGRGALIYIGEPVNPLTPYMARWRNNLWRFLRKQI